VQTEPKRIPDFEPSLIQEGRGTPRTISKKKEPLRFSTERRGRKRLNECRWGGGTGRRRRVAHSLVRLHGKKKYRRLGITGRLGEIELVRRDGSRTESWRHDRAQRMEAIGLLYNLQWNRKEPAHLAKCKLPRRRCTLTIRESENISVS